MNESPFKDIPIKSVDIPFGSKLKLYCGIDFKGSFFVYETSQSCIN